MPIALSEINVRRLAWIGSAALILLPLLLLKLADPAAWRSEDLPFAFVLIAAVGGAAEVALRLPLRWSARAGGLLALGTGAVLMIGNLAVGFAGSEDEPVNAIFRAVPAVALAGSLLAHFRPSGMARVLVITAAAQLTAGLVVLAAGHFTGPLTVAFTGLWLVAAFCFDRAARVLPGAA